MATKKKKPTPESRIGTDLEDEHYDDIEAFQTLKKNAKEARERGRDDEAQKWQELSQIVGERLYYDCADWLTRLTSAGLLTVETSLDDTPEVYFCGVYVCGERGT